MEPSFELMSELVDKFATRRHHDRWKGTSLIDIWRNIRIWIRFRWVQVSLSHIASKLSRVFGSLKLPQKLSLCKNVDLVINVYCVWSAINYSGNNNQSRCRPTTGFWSKYANQDKYGINVIVGTTSLGYGSCFRLRVGWICEMWRIKFFEWNGLALLNRTTKSP